MLSFSFATTLPSGGRDGALRLTVDLDGSLSPLRGPLPAAAGRFSRWLQREPARRSRVPHAALVAIGRAPAPLRPPNRPATATARARVPGGAFVPVGHAARDAAQPPRPHPGRPRIAPAPPARRLARPRGAAMPLRHKLMLALAAEVLLAGTARARQDFRTPAIMIEDADHHGHRIASAAIRWETACAEAARC
ncbi:hypothetical protein [Methylobacterium sp. ID0610]|uniref:hypothetical protein n=1 Tax=Methylobacterium carpenticola TaxID=3344827 RepID=UPI0036952455